MFSFSDLFNAEKWAKSLPVLEEGLLTATWETVYATLLATLFAVIIGLPLGVILFVGEKDGILPLPRWLMRVINFLVNLLRSVPFIILMILVVPITRAIVGTSIGTLASVVPLVIAAFPFVARLVESSLKEVNPNLIEMAESMGASPLQIIVKVLIPESVPSLINNITIALTTILSYTAMSGAVGGGGLGKMAISDGYQRYKYIVVLVATAVIVLIVEILQTVGSKLSVKLDRRLKK